MISAKIQVGALKIVRKKPGCTLGVATGRFRQGKLLHEEGGAGALDLTGDFAVKACGHAGHAAWQDLAALGDEALEKIGVFVIDRLDVEIHATAWHGTVGAAEVRAALWCFRLHGVLFDFAVECMAVQMGVELFLFEPVRCARALFVACGDVARGGFALGFGLGAFEGDVFLWHRFSLWCRWWYLLPRSRSRLLHPARRGR